MRIKKLELVGFKSFKDRTVIQFDKGITGIVGPNGCGKSNIVDALVWVMGEMSAKHLRGSSMEDVIFAGSDDYAPSGLAEVSMVLENDGGPFPAKYLKHSEVMVTRRLHRSGESEYLINKEPARLRDIQEIFMDTGAGAKGFSIIEQGAIGKIITAKPEERRTLIEEAAGITKFKARKRESQRKLVSTDQNLLRLADIVGELKRQLDSLHRQAQRAERYKKLKDQARDIDLWISSKEYAELKKTINQARELFDNAQAIEIDGETNLDQLQAQLAELKLVLAEKENAVGDHQIKHADLQRTVQELDRTVTELRFKIEQGQKNEEMTGSYVAESRQRQEILLREKNELVESTEKVEVEAKGLRENYENKDRELKEFSQRVAEIEQELTSKREAMMEAGQIKSAVEAQAESLEFHIEEVQKRVADNQVILEELQGKRHEYERNKKKLGDALETEKQMQLSIMKDVENFEENKVALVQQVEEKRVEVEEFKDELNRVTSRLYGLDNLQSNFEGFQEGVKNIMFWQKKNQELHADGQVSVSSHFQPVAEVVEVQPGYEVAMEAALGTRLQTLIGETSSQAREALGYLKEKQTGRSSFLSTDLNVLSGNEPAVPASDEIEARLCDVVQVPEKYESQVKSLLQRVAVVDSVGKALEMRPKYAGWTFVTREGDVLDADGILTGGAEESADSGVLKRKAEIKELSQKKDEWAGKLSLAQVSLRKLEERLKTLEADLEQAKEESNRKEIALAALNKDFERAENELQNLLQSISRQESEVEEASSQLSGQMLKLEDLRTRAAELMGEKESLDEATRLLSQEVQEKRESISQLQSVAGNLGAETASKEKEAEGLRRQLEMVDKSLEEVNQRLAKMDEESTKNSETLNFNQVSIEEKRFELEKGILEVESSEKKLAELKDLYERNMAEIREVEENVNNLLKDRSSRQSAMNEAQLKLSESQLKEQYLIEQIEERYMIDLVSVVDNYSDRDGDIKEAKTELEELRKKLSRIGEVNLSAIEEFSETEERHQFLSKQYDDLIEAKEQLRKVIDRINRICSKRFRETFEAVNERFEKVFPVLFGGGEARLVLVENEEKDEMGIDIIAKPPGKKMTSVSLMSGGEKALTAVALIFSIFLVKPSPYCLLDEVDAPLDDANVSRFNDLVKEMAKRSQIIVVTHNKYTMAVNKKLYGVTMEEKGVSRMVSVSLEEAARVSEV